MAAPSVSTLIPPRLKVDRAEKHLGELESILRDHASSNPYRLICDIKKTDPIESYAGTIPAHTAYHYRVKTLTPLPAQISLIFGDVVHNLRAALDLLAYDLIVQNDGSKKFTGFPFDEETKNFEDRLVNGPISVVPDEIKDALRSQIQPYKSGKGKNLWHMNKLDIIDKHRLLLAVSEITGIAGDWKFTNGDALIGSRIENADPEGYLIISATPLIPQEEAALTFKVIAAEREHFPDAELIPTLKQLKAETLNVIRCFEETLSGATGPP